MRYEMRVCVAACCLLLITSLGCQTTYYALWEQLGKEKRHLLRDHVEKAREEQQEATEQFKDVLTRMKEMYGFTGGKLEDFYNKLKSDYEDSEDRAAKVRGRIKDVEQIAADLFREWQTEITEISNQGLREKSKGSLKSSKEQYARLEKAMKKAEASMDPVLRRLKDQVLYLKHNLNAQAVGALKREVGDIEVDVQKLIHDMEKSIREADAFLKSFEAG